MDNCTRYAFTDGRCKKVEGGCERCPGEGENRAKAYHTAAAHRAVHEMALRIPMVIGVSILVFFLAAQAWEGMQRREAAYQSDLRR